MTEHVIVKDNGFHGDDWTGAILDLGPDASDAEVEHAAAQQGLVRVAFPAFSDGRGFTLARRLRLKGFRGRLRATGHVLSDQYAMARRAGFDEVEISTSLAARQPAPEWTYRAEWRSHDYQARLRA